MDIAAFKKNIDLKMENRRKKLEIRKKIQEYKDVKQGLAIQREEQFKPIVEEVKQVKETIDDRQDRLIQKLDENQKALTQDLSLLKELDTFESPPDSPTALEPPPKPKLKIPDPHNGFSQDELDYIQTSGFPTPNEAFKQMLEDDFDLDKLGDDVNDKIARAKHVKAGRSKNKIKNKDEIEDLTRQIDTLKKYIDRINLLAQGEKILVTQKGKGHSKRKYKQKKRNAYKVNKGQYGGLFINPLKLINEMFVEASDPSTGDVVYERRGDKTIVDLLTKRYNPKGYYSPNALQIFTDLNKLANIPIHKSSGKSKLTGGAVMFTNYQDMKDRLVKIVGSINAGNTSIQLRNEAIEILDYLLKIIKLRKNIIMHLFRNTLHDGYTYIPKLFECKQRTES